MLITRVKNLVSLEGEQSQWKAECAKFLVLDKNYIGSSDQEKK